MHVVDRGLATYAYGSITATASATGDGAFASTVTNVDLTGADKGYVFSIDTADGTGSAVTTTTVFAGINLKFDLPGYEGEIQRYNELRDNTANNSPDGNSAEFRINANALGEDTSVTVTADALALNNVFSSTTVSAEAAASGSSSYYLFEGTRRDDRVDGTSGADVIFCGQGDDSVRGINGDDWIFGGEGNDNLTGGSGSDTIFGGNDRDTMTGGDGEDWLFGGKDKDDLDGGTGDDLLVGGDGNDSVRGGDGNDVLCGGKGRDSLFGNGSSDVFRLGAPRGDGDDTYTGGAGADFYWIVDPFDDDVIYDFTVGGGDRLLLDLEAGYSCLSMRRSNCDSNDLEIVLEFGEDASTILLDQFFKLNQGVVAPSRSIGMSQSDSTKLYEAIFIGGINSVLDQAEANLAFANLLAALD